MTTTSRPRSPVRLASQAASLTGWVIPGVLLTILLAVLLIGGAHEIRNLLEARTVAGLPPGTKVTLSTTADAVNASMTDLNGLAASQLFGRYVAPAAETTTAVEAKPNGAQLPEESPGELPEARLGVTLRGVVFATEAAARRAIVDGGSGPFQDYRIGDTLPGDAVIRYIEARRIVVEKGGELLAVSLPETAGGAALIDSGRPENVTPALPTAEGMNAYPAPN